jgi:hypothetical protein
MGIQNEEGALVERSGYGTVITSAGWSVGVHAATWLLVDMDRIEGRDPALRPPSIDTPTRLNI